MRALSARTGGILSYFTRHRTAANLLLAVMVVAGLLAAPRMRAQFFPDVVVNNVIVTVTWEGASAEDVDSAIVGLLEPALLSVDGVTKTQAASRETLATITLEFEPGWDMRRATDEVQSAVDGVVDLPAAADKPVVRQAAWRDRVTDVVLTGPGGLRRLGFYADEFVTGLFQAGVTRTTLMGNVTPEIVAEVPAANLVAHDITMQQVAAALAAEVSTDPAGDVTGADTRLRTGVEKRTPQALAQVVLRRGPDGTNLTVGDIATLRRAGSETGLRYYVGPEPAITVQVDRSASGDAISLKNTVAGVARQMQATLPEGVSLTLTNSRTDAIESRLDMLVRNAATGLALVVGLLFLFLNARTALWVAAGIPVSVLAAVAMMYAAGLTINMISLFALIITLGMVVDDAIVVGEHADARVKKLGEKPLQAAENAANRMALPVFSATLTTLVAFFGLAIIGGRFGDLIYDIPFTVVTVLTASLIECFLILPNHMSHALAAQGARARWYDWPGRVFNRGFDWARGRLFRPAMRLVIVARYPVLAGVVALLAVQAAAVIGGDVPWRFFNAPERSSVTGNFAMAPGATRADAVAMMHELQRATATVEQTYRDKYGQDAVRHVMAQVGGSAGRGLSGTDAKDPDLLGGIKIELLDADLRPWSSYDFLRDLKAEVTRTPMVETLSFRSFRSGPGGDALDVQLYGADAETLKAASQALQASLARFAQVSALEDSLAYDKREMVLELTPQGQALGFTTAGLGQVLRNRVNGIKAATFPDGPRTAELRVELPDSDLTADFLQNMRLRSPAGSYVPLSDIVSVTQRTGFATVRRENGLRLLDVTGDLDQSDAAAATRIKAALTDEILPGLAGQYRVQWRMAGLSEQENEFMTDARLGLIVTLIGIFLVLAWVFSSWTRPLVVMAVIPFGLVGAIWGHAQWGVPLSMFSVVGLLGMTGIIINDAIVLVTTIDEHARTRGLIPAIVDGTTDRLRAVMLTTLTTVLGLAPLLFEKSVQAQFLKPTVITLVYGLGFGMVLVLLVVPALMAAQQDLSRLGLALRRGWRFRAGGVRGALVLTTLALLGWLGATQGWVLATGALPALLAGGLARVAPSLAGLGPSLAGFVLFLGGALVLVTGVYAVLALGQARRGRA